MTTNSISVSNSDTQNKISIRDLKNIKLLNNWLRGVYVIYLKPNSCSSKVCIYIGSSNTCIKRRIKRLFLSELLSGHTQVLLSIFMCGFKQIAEKRKDTILTAELFLIDNPYQLEMDLINKLKPMLNVRKDVYLGNSK